MIQPTLVKGLTPKSYDVLVDGTIVGKVQYHETRYNLRRLYVDRGWFARSASGDRFPDGSSVYATRKAAVEALMESL